MRFCLFTLPSVPLQRPHLASLRLWGLQLVTARCLHFRRPLVSVWLERPSRDRPLARPRLAHHRLRRRSPSLHLLWRLLLATALLRGLLRATWA